MSHSFSPGAARFSRRTGRALVVAVLVGVFSTLFAVSAPAPGARAADLTTFDPGFIITDEIFYDSGAMSATEVKNFIHARQPRCVDYTRDGVTYRCLETYTMDTTSKSADINCAAYAGAKRESAPTIITKVATACGVNPQVLLVILQKEQGFITGGARSSLIYRKAMGFGCPDTADCAKAFYGFFNQVYKAAWQYKQYRNYPVAIPGGGTRAFIANRSNTIRFHPNPKCGSSKVFITNQATAGLYLYTPYQPNRSALAAGYGLGDSCGAYGNRNFFAYFSDWFGNPASMLRNGSFESSSARWASGSSGTIRPTSVIATADLPAKAGTKVLSVTATTPGRSLYQSSSRDTAPGDFVRGGVWVRVPDATATVEGALRVSTTGGTTESVTTPFSATAADGWTWVNVGLPINRSGHTGLRFSVSVTTPNQALLLDAATLFRETVQTSRAEPVVSDQKLVRSGAGGWARSSTSVLRASTRSSTSAYAGGSYLAVKASKPGAYLVQPINRKVRAGTSVTASVWMRSGTPGATYTGRLRLVAKGGTTETASTRFTVGSTWTRVPVTLDAQKKGHSILRLYVMTDTPGKELRIDAARLEPNLVVQGGSFELGTQALGTVPAGTTVAPVTAASLGFAVPDGAAALRITRTTSAESTVLVPTVRKLGLGEKFSASVWVRSATPGVPYTGTLALGARGAGGPNEQTSVPFTTTDAWQQVSVSHTVTVAGMTQLMTSIGLTDAGADILVDGVVVR